VKLDKDQEVVVLEPAEREALARIHDIVEAEDTENRTVEALPIDEVYALEEDVTFVSQQIKRLNRR
jgi:hypothetical protein